MLPTHVRQRITKTLIWWDMKCEAFAVQACGDRDNPTISVSKVAFTLPANPMSDRGQSVCLLEIYENEDCRERGCESDADHIGFTRKQGRTRQSGDWGGATLLCHRRNL